MRRRLRLLAGKDSRPRGADRTAYVRARRSGVSALGPPARANTCDRPGGSGGSRSALERDGDDAGRSEFYDTGSRAQRGPPGHGREGVAAVGLPRDGRAAAARHLAAHRRHELRVGRLRLELAARAAGEGIPPPARQLFAGRLLPSRAGHPLRARGRGSAVPRPPRPHLAHRRPARGRGALHLRLAERDGRHAGAAVRQRPVRPGRRGHAGRGHPLLPSGGHDGAPGSPTSIISRSRPSRSRLRSRSGGTCATCRPWPSRWASSSTATCPSRPPRS